MQLDRRFKGKVTIVSEKEPLPPTDNPKQEGKKTKRGPVSNVVGVFLKPDQPADAESERIKDTKGRLVVFGVPTLLVIAAVAIGLRGCDGSSKTGNQAATKHESDEPQVQYYTGNDGIQQGNCAFAGRVTLKVIPEPLSAGQVADKIDGVSQRNDLCFTEATEVVIKMNTGPREEHLDTNYERNEDVVRPQRLLPANTVIKQP